MSTTDGYMPMVTCPHCKQEFQWDDYYDVKTGSEHDCPRCEAVIEVMSAEQLLYCTFAVKKAPDSASEGQS